MGVFSEYTDGRTDGRTVSDGPNSDGVGRTDLTDGRNPKAEAQIFTAGRTDGVGRT